MPDTVRSLTRRAILAAGLVLMLTAHAAAQQPQPLVAPAPARPEFFSRYDFHMNAAGLIQSQTPPIVDDRFSWDAHFGGSFDLVDYVGGSAGVILNYEAVLGSEFRPFDPNQGNYILEGSLSKRIGDASEIVAFFHHVSRHLSDRAKPIGLPVAWNELGARVLHRTSVGTATVDIDLEGGRAVEHAYVDYTWMGEAHVLVRRPRHPDRGRRGCRDPAEWARRSHRTVRRVRKACGRRPARSPAATLGPRRVPPSE